MSYQGAHTGAEVDDAVGVAKGAGTGIVVKTGPGAGVMRSIAGSANIDVANGDGAAGDISFDFSASALASLDRADTALQPEVVATVATTGAYADLSGLPTLGTAAATDSTAYATAAQGGLADTATQPGDLALVATSGAYGDLAGLPALGTMSAESALDYTPTSGLGTAAFTASTEYATAAQGARADTAAQPADLAAVATSGAYTDLSGLPVLGTAASTDAADYATAAQGSLAESAAQASGFTAIAVVNEGAIPEPADPDTLYIEMPA